MGSYDDEALGLNNAINARFNYVHRYGNVNLNNDGCGRREIKYLEKKDSVKTCNPDGRSLVLIRLGFL